MIIYLLYLLFPFFLMALALLDYWGGRKQREIDDQEWGYEVWLGTIIANREGKIMAGIPQEQAWNEYSVQLEEVNALHETRMEAIMA